MAVGSSMAVVKMSYEFIVHRMTSVVLRTMLKAAGSISENFDESSVEDVRLCQCGDKILSGGSFLDRISGT